MIWVKTCYKFCSLCLCQLIMWPCRRKDWWPVERGQSNDRAPSCTFSCPTIPCMPPLSHTPPLQLLPTTWAYRWVINCQRTNLHCRNDHYDHTFPCYYSVGTCSDPGWIVTRIQPMNHNKDLIQKNHRLQIMHKSVVCQVVGMNHGVWGQVDRTSCSP